MNVDYELSHTPSQIAEEQGWLYVRHLYEGFYEKYRGAITFRDINIEDYLDSLPPEEYFEKKAEETGFTPLMAKLSFIAKASMYYAMVNKLEEREYGE